VIESTLKKWKSKIKILPVNVMKKCRRNREIAALILEFGARR